MVFCSGLYDDALVGAYQQADVFFMPSVQELCPLVAVEAMAAGLPEMVTDVGGCQDMVTHGHNGLIAPPGDVEAMASGLESLLVDPLLRERMGRASRERSRHYGWDSISRLYLDQRSLSLEDNPAELDAAPLPSTGGNGR